MAKCIRCCGRLLKRADGWYHCRRHGPARKINSPYKINVDTEDVDYIVTEITKQESK